MLGTKPRAGIPVAQPRAVEVQALDLRGAPTNESKKMMPAQRILSQLVTREPIEGQPQFHRLGVYKDANQAHREEHQCLATCNTNLPPNSSLFSKRYDGDNPAASIRFRARDQRRVRASEILRDIYELRRLWEVTRTWDERRQLRSRAKFWTKIKWQQPRLTERSIVHRVSRDLAGFRTVLSEH